METPDTTITTWIMSPSQLVDYLSCPRKWWFRRVAKLPEEEDVKKWDFGHCLHEVCERWVSADNRGRDATGQPVDLYPEGWEKGRLTKQELKLIKVTVEKAAEGEVLRRMPGRETEVKYRREVIEGVEMVGALDVDHPSGFEDHKSVKRRAYMLSQKKLASDDKMLCYAYEKILRWWEEEGELDPERTVNMRFNYFSKDPSDPFVKVVEVEVKASDVVQWWEETVVPAAEDMLRMQKEALSPDDWGKVEGPREAGACQSYGGCKYARICTRVIKPSKYAAQIDRINSSRSDNSTRKKTPMASKIFTDTKKRKGGTPAKTAAKKTTAKKTQKKAAKPTPEPEVAESAEVAPWARAGCKVCGGKGYKDGAVCGACDRINGATGKTTSADFEVIFTDEGTLVFAGDLGEGEIVLVDEPVEVEKKPTVEASAKKTKAKKPVKEEVAEEEYEEVEPEEEEPIKPPVPKKPRKKTTAKKTTAKKTTAKKTTAKKTTAKKADEEGESTLDQAPEFPDPETTKVEAELGEDAPAALPTGGAILYVNCMPVGVEVIEFSDILAKEGMDLAEEKGLESYYDIPAYERQPLLASCAAEVVSELSGHVVATTGASDIDAYLAACRPFFSMVIQGTR